VNFYRRWGRWYASLTFFSGRLSVEEAAEEDRVYAARAVADEYAADDPHPFQDAEALQGNIITPVGAQSFKPNYPSNKDGS